MRKIAFTVSGGAAILAAAAFLLLDLKMLTAILLPIAAHECGHLLTMRLLGLRVTAIRAELKGFCIEYLGEADGAASCFTAAAGPMAGLLYGLAASRLGCFLESETLCFSAGVSLILTLFNLLPILPLDGGRILLQLATAIFGEMWGRRISAACSLSMTGLVLTGGLLLLIKGRSAALLPASVWLLASREDHSGLVKNGEVL